MEILISEQFRRYSAKMQDIQQLEYAEAQAVNQLKLSRQNTVRDYRKDQERGQAASVIVLKVFHLSIVLCFKTCVPKVVNEVIEI